MANNKVTITVNTVPIIGDYIGFDVDLYSVIQYEEWVTTRSRRGEAPVAYSTINEVAAQYAYYFNIDFNHFSQYEVTVTDNVIEIIHQNEDAVITNFGSTFATGVISSEAPDEDFEIDSSVKSGIDCKQFSLELTANELIDEVIINGSSYTTGHNNTVLTLTLDRGIHYEINLIDYESNYAVYACQLIGRFSIDCVPFLLESNVEITSSLVVSTYTTTVDVDDVVGLTLEYSLDGITYQSSNIFTGQTVGNYTMYIKDDFNCEITKTYTVSQAPPENPFVEISIANSINYSRQQIVDGCSIFQNDENSLQNQKLVDIKACDYQFFQTCDVTSTQIKTNYIGIYCEARSVVATNDVITVVKMSDNMNQFMSLDCWHYQYSTTETALYFTVGDLYDNVGADIGDFELNGEVPVFAEIGNSIAVDGLGTFIITQVLYDEDINKKVIIFDNVAPAGTIESIVSSVYDILPYEIYEFEQDWDDYDEDIYDNMLLFSNDVALNVEPAEAEIDDIYISENILVAEEHEDTIGIKYYNSHNRDIFYEYGIENFIRVPILHIEAVPQVESEINITDNSAFMVDSEIHQANKFIFGYVSSQVMRKILAALISETVFINGIGYVQESSPSVENVPNSDLYNIEAIMIKTNVNEED